MANKNNGILVSLANLISSAVVSRIWDILPAVDSVIGMKGLNLMITISGLDRFNLFEDVLGFGFGRM
jgi:hypothetical protein